ncbi:MAG: acyl carrier protein, partial [Lachnospiraceae bacterium]|nr:acyl carrier protein [Lachnospiraceae bacterium]
MEEVLKLLKKIREDIDYENTKDLISGKVLKSFEVLMLISNIEEQFDIEIDPEEMSPEYFDSADSIAELIKKK